MSPGKWIFENKRHGRSGGNRKDFPRFFLQIGITPVAQREKIWYTDQKTRIQYTLSAEGVV